MLPIVYSCCDIKKVQPEVLKSDFRCGKCWLDAPVPPYCDTCPGSPDYTCAKGKGARKKYNYVNVNQKKVKV